METVDLKDVNEDLYNTLRDTVREEIEFIRNDYVEDCLGDYEHRVYEAALEMVFNDKNFWDEYNRLIDEANRKQGY